MGDQTAADRCRGVLIGLAAGDRIGGPLRMAVRLAEGLADRAGFDPDDTLDRYVSWFREGAYDTGPTASEVLALVAAGVPAAEAALRVHRDSGGMTAGCNPAHRSPPLAMCAAIPDSGLAACAAAEAALTHYHPLAGEVAAAGVVLCRSLTRGAAWEDAVRGCPFAGGADDGPGERGGFAPDVLRAAVYFVGTSAGFAEAVERAVAFAGPANYSPVLAGAIAGARWGGSAVPATMLGHVGILHRVEAATDALAFGWGGWGNGRAAMRLSLCETCEWVRVVTTPRGSRFLMCRRSQSDPPFPKYPPQPVARCGGYEPGDAGSAEADRRREP